MVSPLRYLSIVVLVRQASDSCGVSRATMQSIYCRGAGRHAKYPLLICHNGSGDNLGSETPAGTKACGPRRHMMAEIRHPHFRRHSDCTVAPNNVQGGVHVADVLVL